MAVKIDVGDDNPAADPCCVAGKVVCGIPASLFGMDFLSAGQCAIGNGGPFVLDVDWSVRTWTGTMAAATFMSIS